MSGEAGIDVAPGVKLFPEWLDRDAQQKLADEVEAALIKAPLYRPHMPRTNAPMSVAMSNLGSLGWFSDAHGYKYIARHPDTGAPWPPIPAMLLAAWSQLTGYGAPPEACLVNWYEPRAKMGMHQDRDERDFSAPVLSFSLGDAAIFRLGGANRRDPTRSLRLSSGDVLMLGGPGRLAFHGVDRIIPGTSSLLKRLGRLNLTLRRVTLPE